MADANLTPELLRQLLDYDPETGVFTNRVKRGKSRSYPGEVAGHLHKFGYRVTTIRYVRYPEHRLAWLYVHGTWPTGEIDHINGNRADNRIANLRDVTPQINQENRRIAHQGSRTGLLGVYPSSKGDKWISRIRVQGKVNHLGTFDCPDAAHAAYIEAKRRLHKGCTI